MGAALRTPAASPLPRASAAAAEPRAGRGGRANAIPFLLMRYLRGERAASNA